MLWGRSRRRQAIGPTPSRGRTRRPPAVACAASRRRLRVGSPAVPPVPRPSIHLPAPGTKRATVIGAGAVGAAVGGFLPPGGRPSTFATPTGEQGPGPAGRRGDRGELS